MMVIQQVQVAAGIQPMCVTVPLSQEGLCCVSLCVSTWVGTHVSVREYMWTCACDGI